jgi:hypothetical protein
MLIVNRYDELEWGQGAIKSKNLEKILNGVQSSFSEKVTNFAKYPIPNTQ